MRRIAVVTLGGLALFGFLATPANAVTDPVAAISCLAQSVGDLTSIVDPASPGVPSEVPGASCLAP
jgi:hypothetical protein